MKQVTGSDLLGLISHGDRREVNRPPLSFPTGLPLEFGSSISKGRAPLRDDAREYEGGDARRPPEGRATSSGPRHKSLSQNLFRGAPGAASPLARGMGWGTNKTRGRMGSGTLHRVQGAQPSFRRCIERVRKTSGRIDPLKLLCPFYHGRR